MLFLIILSGCDHDKNKVPNHTREVYSLKSHEIKSLRDELVVSQHKFKCMIDIMEPTSHFESYSEIKNFNDIHDVPLSCQFLFESSYVGITKNEW